MVCLLLHLDNLQLLCSFFPLSICYDCCCTPRKKHIHVHYLCGRWNTYQYGIFVLIVDSIIINDGFFFCLCIALLVKCFIEFLINFRTHVLFVLCDPFTSMYF